MTEAKPLSMMDSMFLTIETDTVPLHLGGSSILRIPDGARVDFVRRLYDDWRNHPVTRSPFNYRLSPSGSKLRPEWEVMDDVDLSQHFFHLALPRPGTDRQLLELTGNLHSRRLDRSRPLWEIYLIEGLDNRRFALYVKIHHALVDGTSAMRLLGGEFPQNRKMTKVPPPWTTPSPNKTRRTAAEKRSDSEPDPTEQTAEQGGLRKLYDVLSHASGLAFNAKELSPPRFGGPDSILNRPITARRTGGTAVFDFAHVKKLSKTAECTINDIVLTVCGGALRDYLLHLGELPEKSLVCCVPVALNKAGNADGGNTVANMPVDFGTDIAQAGARLAAVQAGTKQGKAFLHKLGPELATIYTLASTIPMQIENVREKRLTRTPMYNTVVTNVPGPRESRYLAGARMLEIFPFMPILGTMALAFGVVSMQEQLIVAYTACPDVLSESERIGPLLTQHMTELEAFIAKQAATATRKKTASRSKSKTKRVSSVASKQRSRSKASGSSAQRKRQRTSRQTR